MQALEASLQRLRDHVKLCERAGIWFMPWAPLGEGLGAPRDEVQWLLHRSPVTIPIPGTSSIAHLEELMC
jgi:aryl-alcohol dehydrogenase-like predicted oxidoreductase